MKNLKKLTAMTLAILMLLSSLCAVAFAADGKITVSLRIEGLKECMYYSDVTVNDGATVLDVLKEADEKSDALTVSTVDSYYGPYVNKINDLEEKTFKGFDGWNYNVNGVIPDVGVSKYTVKAEDSVVLYYGDPFGVGMQYPEIDISNLSDGKISFISKDTEYDENWNPVTKINTVTGYTLTWGYDGKTVTLTPDENGVVTIDKKYLTSESHSVQIERYAENGCPTVLRFAPDFTVFASKGTSLFQKIISSIRDFFKMIIDFIRNLFAK